MKWLSPDARARPSRGRFSLAVSYLVVGQQATSAMLMAQTPVRLLFLLALLSRQAVNAANNDEHSRCQHNDELQRCAKSLTLWNSSTSSFPLQQEQLKTLCPELKIGLACIDNYTHRCMDPKQRDDFNNVFLGSTKVIREICEEGPFQEEFLKHASCMQEAKSEYDDCADQYYEKMKTIVSQDENNRRHLCCSFQDFLRCSQTIIMNKCGEDTARFTATYLDKMSHSLIQKHCTKYQEVDESCSGNAASLTANRALLVISSTCSVLGAAIIVLLLGSF